MSQKVLPLEIRQANLRNTQLLLHYMLVLNAISLEQAKEDWKRAVETWGEWEPEGKAKEG